MTKTSTITLCVLIFLLAVFGVYWYRSRTTPPASSGQIACTLEAKLCSDGSYVGRRGPSCQFAPCPLDASGWKTATSTESGLSFQYPLNFGTTYISTVDWPPKLNVIAEPFACTEAGLETQSAGQTQKRTIENRVYCVTKESEGAAGSMYTMYAYAFSRGDKTAILTFSLRFVQCGNYGDPQRIACENERTTFDEGPVLDRMAQSVR